ncbi:glycoside hydrolase family 95-like protein [Plantactinospora endophytica]|uniref:Tat pathway signal sequence domain protein n=1 Tax=Plantactinospora endophytica TaxID=673535 RepID=A0ABQ4E6L0_9ACTN|nr:twin-arginine translocation signal domain-containing protein [Plantactinospora endophytica]GIG90344.1 hypothetical protein Pen02_52800 [Plantactinospora endophytica]
MSGIERRQFLRGLAVAGFAAAGGARLFDSGPAWASSGAAADPHETVVRDATMLWTRPPTGWWNAPFLGDGSLTAQVYAAARGTGLTFAIGAAGTAWHTPTARFTLPLAGTLTGARWQLDPWNAELTGTVSTTRGSLKFTVAVPRGSGVLLAGFTPGGGERAAGRLTGATDELGWRDRWTGSRRWVAIGDPATGVRELLAKDPEQVLAAHRRWWHDHYSGSFVSVPDKTLQRFHWLQVYAAASTARSDPAGGLDTPSTLASTNHLELHPAAAAAAGGDWPQSFDHLVFATPGAGLKSGDAENPVLAWNLPEVWDSYRYGGDARILSGVLQPMLRSAVGYYANFLLEGADGRLHLPSTYSPGYGDVEDSTHDLSLLRWAAGRLVESARPGDPAYAELDRWRGLLDRLVPYHTDETGVLLGAGVRLTISQAQPAHLLWMHPLGEKAWRRDGDRDLMRRSLDHWSGMPEAWTGRSYLSAATMAVGVRAPELALRHLGQVVAGGEHAGSRLGSSTLYRDGRVPQPGASFEAAQVMMRMLVSGDDDNVVEVFPGLPGAWRDASIGGLRAPGAFVLDASRSDGRTDWIRVRSEAGRPLLLQHGIAGAVEVRDESGRLLPAEQAGPGVLRLQPAAGATVEVRASGPVRQSGLRDVPALGTGRQWGYTGAAQDELPAVR